MKKITTLMIVVLFGIIGVTGCTNKTAPTVATSDTAELSTEAVTEALTDPPIDTTTLFKDMSGSYGCSAGTKGGTTLYLATDGTFVGSYGYFQTAVGDEEAPKGVIDVARIRGSLKNTKRMGNNKLFADISDLEYLTEPGTEEIINGCRYRYTITDHIASNDQFYIYTPEALCSEVPEDSLTWLKFNGAMPKDEDGPIGKYLLYNKRSGETFYQTIKAELAPGETLPEADSEEEHTGEELLKMNVPQILELMGNDISVHCQGEKYYIFPMGYVYFYNFDKLPGFVFYIQPERRPNTPPDQFSESDLADIKSDILAGKYNDIRFLAITDGARLNQRISSNMTYSQISSTVGTYSVNPIAGAGSLTQDITSACENVSYATVSYTMPQDASQHVDENGRISSEFLLQNDPKVKCIILSNN